MSKKRFVNSVIGMMLAIGLVISWNSSLTGQEAPEYETLEIAEEYRFPAPPEAGTSDSGYKNACNAISAKRRNMQRRVTDNLKRSGGGPEIEEFISGFVIPEMTQLDDTTLARLGELRQRFFRFYLEDTDSQNLRTQLIELTVDPMKRIAQGNFHPAARVNAMLVLGRLNDREGNQRADELPQPVPEISPWLLTIATDESQPEYLRVTALTGLKRHTNLRGPGTVDEIANSEKRQIGDAMVNLIGQQPSESLSGEAVYWMKRQAVQVLGFLRQPGDNGRYAKALRDVINDDEEKLLLRTEAAESYARLEFADAAQANVGEMTEAIGNLVAEAARADAGYLDQRRLAIEFIGGFLDGKSQDQVKADSGGPELSTGGGGGSSGSRGPGGGAGGGAGNPEAVAIPEILPAYHRELVRRRFKSYCWSGKVALAGPNRTDDGGLSRYANTEEAAFIKDVVSDFKEVMLTTDVREGDEDDNRSRRNTGLGTKDEEEDAEPMTLADKLKKALTEGADDISGTIAKHRPDEAARGLPEDSQPDAADGDAEGN